MYLLNFVSNMLEAAVSPWYGFVQNMAYVMMNHLPKSGPTNLQLTFGYSVHLVSAMSTCQVEGLAPLITNPPLASFTTDFTFCFYHLKKTYNTEVTHETQLTLDMRPNYQINQKQLNTCLENIAYMYYIVGYIQKSRSMHQRF